MNAAVENFSVDAMAGPGVRALSEWRPSVGYACNFVLVEVFSEINPKTTSSWWFFTHPFSPNMRRQNGFIGVKIQKNFELPPPTSFFQVTL